MRRHECIVCGERVNTYPESRCDDCKRKVRQWYESEWRPSKLAQDARDRGGKWTTTDDGVRYRKVWDG